MSEKIIICLGWRYIALVIFLFCGSSVQAYTGHCEVLSGDPYIGGSFSKTLTDAENQVNSTQDPFYSWGSAAGYVVACDCDVNAVSSGVWAFSASSPLPATSDGWYALNDYLEVKVRARIKGSVMSDIPFDNISTGAEDRTQVCSSGVMNQGSVPSGNSGEIALRIRKPIVGDIVIPQTVVAELWECYNVPASSDCAKSGSSIIKYYVSGTLSATQECVVGAKDGQGLSVDLGMMIPRGSFKIKGQPAAGAYAVKSYIYVTCSSGVSATANLKITLSAVTDADSPSMIKTDKEGVGVLVRDSQGNVIDPAGGTVPFTLASGAATLHLTSVPGSTTGIPPEAGEFNAIANINVTYD